MLIRACEPERGLAEIRRRRGVELGPSSLAGPGKVGAALALDTAWSDHPLYRAGGLSLLAGPPPERILAGPRVGIEFACAEDQRRAWRFASGDSDWVSHRRGLGER